jgi:hypothetical protein
MIMNDDSFTALSVENVSMRGCGNNKKERRKIKKGMVSVQQYSLKSCKAVYDYDKEV